MAGLGPTATRSRASTPYSAGMPSLSRSVVAWSLAPGRPRLRRIGLTLSTNAAKPSSSASTERMKPSAAPAPTHYSSRSAAANGIPMMPGLCWPLHVGPPLTPEGGGRQRPAASRPDRSSRTASRCSSPIPPRMDVGHHIPPAVFSHPRMHQSRTIDATLSGALGGGPRTPVALGGINQARFQ